VPLRTLQEWLGHRDFKTTLIYANYAASEREDELIELAYGHQTAINASASEGNSARVETLW
jgi:hypothetical protein